MAVGGERHDRLGLAASRTDHERGDGRTWRRGVFVRLVRGLGSDLDLVIADLDDADDPVVDVKVVLREGQRLHVSYNLFGGFARCCKHMDFGR